MRRPLALVALLLMLAVPAQAHSDEGEMTVTIAEQSGPDAITVEVGIVYVDDGHLAEEATVFATLTGPSGQAIGPVELPRIAGARYGAEINISGPGSWSVLISSEEPTSTTEVDVDVAAPTTTTVAPPSTTTTVPESTTTTAMETTTTAPIDDPDEQGGLPVAAVVVAGLLVGGGFAFLRRRGSDPAA